MSSRERRQRLLRRWYPASWRERYGDDLLDYLDDAYPTSRLPLRALVSLVRSGTWERCRANGLVGEATKPEQRVRVGALGVLGAWTIIVVAGSFFAKYSEHWDASTPAPRRAIPSMAMSVLQVSAFAGVILCAAAGLLSSRSLWRWSRSTGVRHAMRLVRPALVALVVATTTSAVVIDVAHHLSATQRNGALTWYQVVGVAWSLTLALCLAVAYVTVARVAMRLEYSHRELAVLSRLARGVAASIGVIVASFLVWWIAMARSAPSFFSTAVGGVANTSVPLPMIVTAVVMLVGLLVALWGVYRSRSLGAVS